MKSPLALFVVSFLTLCYVVFQVLTAKPRGDPDSAVALVHRAVQYRCCVCTEHPAYGIDTVFRTFGPTVQQAAAARKQRVDGVLTQNPRVAFLAGADATCLVTPNASPELRALRQRQAGTPEYNAPQYLVTYSAACPLPDGSTCFYVERLSQGPDRQMGNGDIYVVRKGAVVSVVSVWTN